MKRYQVGGLASAVGVDPDEIIEEALPQTTPAAVKPDPYAGIRERIGTTAESTRAALTRARDQLLSRQAEGPDESMKWLRIAQAMGAPTRTGAFGESLGATAGVLAEQRAADQARQRAEEEQLLKYDLDLAGVDQSLLQSELALQKLMQSSKEPVKVGEKETLVDPDTGRIIFKGKYAEDLELKDRIKIERDFRNDFQKQSGDFIKQNDAYGRILASAEDPSAAGDLALVFNFMKVLDPRSVVRESEFRTAEGARGALQDAEEGGEYVPAFLHGIVERMTTGKRMTPVQRADFVNRAGKLYGDAAETHKGREGEFRRISEINNLNPDIVVGESLVRDIGGVAIPPEAGEIVGGYRFKGGDPGVEESWELVTPATGGAEDGGT